MSRTLRLLAPVRQQAAATSISVKKAQSPATAGPSSCATRNRTRQYQTRRPVRRRPRRAQQRPRAALCECSCGRWTPCHPAQSVWSLSGSSSCSSEVCRSASCGRPWYSAGVFWNSTIRQLPACSSATSVCRALTAVFSVRWPGGTIPTPGPEYDGDSPERPQGAHLGDARGGGVISEDRGQVVQDLRADRLATVAPDH